MSLGRLALTLPLGTCLLLWGVLSIHRARLGMGRLSVRGTLVLAFVAFEVLLVAVTELLSVGHHLTTGKLAAAWLVVTVATAAAAVRSGGPRLAVDWMRGGGLGRARRALTSTPAAGIGVAVLVAMGVVLVLTAWWYLPNNPDSLVYHLARVASWDQAGSVHHFATHYTAQLELAPLHEFNLLHLHVLLDTDRLDGFVQLASFVVAVVGVSELARLLGASREAQVLAGVVAATIPSVVLEATSTGNNLFAGAVGVGLVLVLLAWEPLARTTPLAVALGGVSALAVLSKGTVGPMLGPVALLLVVRVVVTEVRQSSWSEVARRATRVAVVAGGCVLLLAGPFFQRNLELFDSFGGPVSRGTLNDAVSARASAGNVVRTVAANFRIGDDGDGFESVTSRRLLAWLRDVHDLTGAREDDPDFTLGSGVDAFAPGDFSEYERSEDYGANPWHVLLMAVALVVLAVALARGDPSAGLPMIVGLALAAGFVAFASLTRWSLYTPRYHEPLLLLWAPVIALAIAKVHRLALQLVGAALIVACLPQLLDNLTRPVLDRLEVASDLSPYFAPRADDVDTVLVPEGDYLAVRDAIVAVGCDRVGLGNWVVLEYPLWAGFQHLGWDAEIRHVGVTNASRRFEDRHFEPCAVVRWVGWNPPLTPIDGLVDVPIGGMVLSVEPEQVDRLVRAGVSPST